MKQAGTRFRPAFLYSLNLWTHHRDKETESRRSRIYHVES